MKSILMVAACAALLVAMGCKARPIKYLAVNDKPLSEKEQEWSRTVLRLSDSLVAVDSVRDYGYVVFNRDGTIRREIADTTNYVVTERAYVAPWGRISPYGVVTIDGVGNVHEPGRWWRVVREALNGLARSNDYRAWQADSIRLFKLDSTMTAIGR